MDEQLAAKLVAMNRTFYAERADPFAFSRVTLNHGFTPLLDYFPKRPFSLLDVGCGNGRFGYFVRLHRPLSRYVGIDLTPELLQKAAELTDGEFFERDLTQANSLANLGTFDVIVCMAALHHIPGRARRVRLLQEISDCLTNGGIFCLATWQFMSSERQRRKLRDWSEVGVAPDQLEPNDYLLSWQRGGFSYRYVCMIDAQETADLAKEAGLQMIDHYRSDGREGNLSLYAVMQKQGDKPNLENL